MKKQIIFCGAILASICLVSCKNENKKESIATEEISFTKEAELYLIKQNGDTLKRLDLEIADTEYERETGLMYRSSMANDQGMLFVFEDERPRSFYMKNTQIPLDIIYIGHDQEVVKIIEEAQPYNEASLPSQAPAQYVLEINAGLSQQWNLEKGDRISYQIINSAESK